MPPMKSFRLKKTSGWRMKLVLSIIAAVAATAALSGTASAAPSMWIDQVVSPSGVYSTQGQATWHLGLDGVGAWQSADCNSNATWAAKAETARRGVGTSSPWTSWAFRSGFSLPYEGPSSRERVFSALTQITAECDLARTVYLGKRPYRRTIEQQRDGDQAVSRRPNGCSIYSYSESELTIDCRRSRTSGSATWMFGRHRTDRGGRYGIHFDTSQSTIGAHPISSRVTPTRVFVTETVSRGTMITVTDVYLRDVSRKFWRKVYRRDSKTLTASWPS